MAESVGINTLRFKIGIFLIAALLASREGLSARKVFFECELPFRQAQHLPEKNTPLAAHLASHWQDATPAAPPDPAVPPPTIGVWRCWTCSPPRS